DHDHTVSEDLRFVQLTPPGSACSICIGKGITDAEPGSVVGMQVVVKDIEEAEREFKSRGIDISPIDDQAWGRFIYFADPDGNKWAVQEIVIPDLSGSNS
ncbi:MAG: VOC family protein, partial [Rhodococcus sp. (in: high G+C Gram-positive bacteria)]